MTQPSRHRLPWSMSETNRLYNEYELKQLPILTIAKLHARSQYAILHKLSHECLINKSWNDVKGWDGLKKFQTNMDMQSDDDDFEEEDHDSDSDYTESDDEESEADDESVISEESLEDCDDPNDSDYVDEEMDEDDDDDSSDYEDDGEDDDEDYKEFDPYSIPQKVSSLKKLIDSAKFFLYSH